MKALSIGSVPEPCRSPCQHVRVTRPAVLFGGPSPEHDISVLTGLQAVTALRNDGVDVTAIYWSKAAEFYEVDVGLDPAAFVDGVPRGATRLDLVARPGAGFVPEAGRLGRRTPLSISASLASSRAALTARLSSPSGTTSWPSR